MENKKIANMCRACMSSEGPFESIFNMRTSSADNINYADMLMTYTNIQIAIEDGLPDQICTTCAGKTVELYNFKQRCQETDSVLRVKIESLPEDSTSLDIDIKSEYMKLQADISSASVRALDIKNDSLGIENDDLIIDEANDMKNLTIDDNISENEEDTIYYESLEDVEDPEDIDELPPEMEPQIEYIIGEEIVEHSDVNQKRKEDRFHRCDICEKSFKKQSNLTRHLNIHASVKGFYCKDCNKGFARFQQLSHHMNMHSGIKPHTCKICSKGFNQMSNLKDHMRTHNGEKPFLCSTCGKGFNQLGNLRQHTVRHSGVKTHLCNICGAGFASKGELGAHTRKHTGARPFVCAVCNNGFTTSSSLTKHKRIHSGEKPYECEVCKMRFSRSGILARHKRTHTGEKPYVCKHCTRAFSQSNDLSSHLRIHTGEKPFVCDICGQAFRQSSALKTHKKIHVGKDITGQQTTKKDFLDKVLKIESGTIFKLQLPIHDQQLNLVHSHSQVIQ